MEMNQKLFDECSQKYKQDRLREKEKAREREDLWSKIECNAKKNPKVGFSSSSSSFLLPFFLFSINKFVSLFSIETLSQRSRSSSPPPPPPPPPPR
jgi:hypothetical protein